jgi:hypothetical protein
MAEDHRYNDPTLSPLAFLRAVYSDPSVPMLHRMRAAEVAALYESRPVFLPREPSLPGEVRVVIRIEGLPAMTSVTVDHGSADHGHQVVGHA